MIHATSTRTTAVYPDLGLRLPAGVAVPLPDATPATIERLQVIPGVVVEDLEPTPESPTPTEA